MAILHARRPKESVLLTRRAERDGDSWSGHWSLPGGRREPEDPDALQTALRELEEETGIRLARTDVQAALPATMARRRVGPFLLVAPFLFRVENELPTVLDPNEAVEALWMPMSVLLDPAQHCLRPVPGLPGDRHFPAIDLNGVPLWGFTYRLISDWLGLCPKDLPAGQAAFKTASAVLDFLLTHGMTLEHGWEDRTAQEGQQPLKTAAVRGVIPAAAVVARFATPGRHVPTVNCLEVRPDYIRITGLAFEEYVIHASG